MTEADDNNVVNTPEMFFLYINMEVGLPSGNDGEIYHTTVKLHKIGNYWKLLGIETSNPITISRLYEV